MKVDEFILRMKQGDSAELGEYVYFGHKVNDSVNVVYRRKKDSIFGVTAEGYVEQGRDTYVYKYKGDVECLYNNLKFEDAKDYDLIESDYNIRKMLADLISDRIGEICVERYGEVKTPDIFTDRNLQSGSLYINQKEGILECAKDSKEVVSDAVVVRRMNAYFIGYEISYIDSGFEAVDMAAKEYIHDERLTESDYEAIIYGHEAIKDFFLNPDKHLSEWLGMEINSAVGDKRGIKCEYIDYETGEKQSCLFINKIREDRVGYIEGEAKVGRKRKTENKWVRFVDIDRLFYYEACIYDKQREADRIKSSVFKAGLSGLIEAVKRTGINDKEWYGKNRIEDMREGSLVYLSDIGHFGIVVYQDVSEHAMEKNAGTLGLVLDDGNRMRVTGDNLDSFMIRDREMNQGLEEMKEHIECKYLGRAERAGELER